MNLITTIVLRNLGTRILASVPTKLPSYFQGTKQSQQSLRQYSTINKSIQIMADSRGLVEIAKRSAAYKAVDEHIKDNQIIGIGSGSTVIYAVERIAERKRTENLNLICIPTSFQAKNLIIDNGLTLSDLDAHSEIDVTIDGCDECDVGLNLIKGGGGCLLQEKIVASASKKLVVVADYTKDSMYIGHHWKKGIPLEVSQIGWKVVLKKLNNFIREVGGGSAEDAAKIRLAVKKMGPVVTDNSNFIVDFQIGEILKASELHTPASIEAWLKTIPGILETGLFVRMASHAYFGLEDGSVKIAKSF